MAVDISTDLNITLLACDIETPTPTGVYNSGSPPGTYQPGRDYSPVDNVSTGNIVQLNFCIAFDSISNQHYGLDRVYIQSVDDPRTDGTGTVPGRWINQNPDPTDITDNGRNTIIPDYTASISPIVFEETANIKSDSTLTTVISLTMPFFAFWWKSKLMPTIQVVAVKDGIQKVSAPLTLPTILLSTAGILRSALCPSGKIIYTSMSGQKGFYVPFSISTFKDDVPNITQMYDNAEFNLITYQVDYTVYVNATPIPLFEADFSVLNIAGGTLESLSYGNGLLTVVVRQTTPGTVGVRIANLIPFDATEMKEAPITINGKWRTAPPIITGFINSYLFTQTHSGSLNQYVVVDTSGRSPCTASGGSNQHQLKS